MKTLYITRHAKSSWETPNQADHKRDILNKGRKRTQLIGGYLIENDAIPELIISSHAKRAFETAKIIADTISYPKDKILVTDKIYFGHTEEIFQFLFEQDNNIDSVMLVGHNPTFTYLANYFLDDKIDNLPTSAIVAIQFDTEEWENIFSAKHAVKFVVTPRKLKDN